MALVAAVVLVFGQTVAFEFVDWDDGVYVSENPRVLDGLSLEGLRWAFTPGEAVLWVPLAWLSHMLDVDLFGTWAGGHHLTNVLLHAANAVLLLVWLARATGRPGRAACVAAIWALHPLRVESVAWVTERKDVLCGLFFLLTLLAYDRWAKGRRPLWYLMVSAGLLGALLAKPMAITLPVVLWLLGTWLYDQDGERHSLRAQLQEKWPWLALSTAVALVAFSIVSGRGNTYSDAALALPLRVANALVSYVRYLGLSVWPIDLSALYPHPNLGGGQPWRWWQILAATALLAAISAWAWAARRRCPAIAVGWAWYLVTLVPVIGLVQSGGQALADRFTYLPQIGLLIATVWGSADLAERRGFSAARHSRRRLALAVVLLATVLAAVAARQCSMWRDSESLFARSLAVTPRNPLLLHGLARVRSRAGDLKSAEPLLRSAIALEPGFPEAQLDLAYLLATTGRTEAAQKHAELALEMRPGNAAAHSFLGELLAASGQHGAARREFARALELDPNLHRARLLLGRLENETSPNP